jgi:zinc transport system permease protein
VSSTWAEFVEAFELFRDPILAGGAAGVALGLLSIFIILRRMAFLSATLAQSAGLGVALAFYLEIVFKTHVSAVLGAGLMSLLTALLVSGQPERYKVTRESFLAMVYIAAGALAVILGNKITQEAHDVHAILFGSAVLVRYEDFVLLAIGAAVTVVAVVLLWRGFLFANFDAEGAAVQGVPTRVLNAALFGLIIFMDAVATRALGALPVFAFSTLPGLAALTFTRRLGYAAVLATLFGVLAGAGGYVVAFFYDAPVGATQTVVAVAIAGVGLLYRRILGR